MVRLKSFGAVMLLSIFAFGVYPYSPDSTTGVIASLHMVASAHAAAPDKNDLDVVFKHMENNPFVVSEGQNTKHMTIGFGKYYATLTVSKQEDSKKLCTVSQHVQENEYFSSHQLNGIEMVLYEDQGCDRTLDGVFVRTDTKAALQLTDVNERHGNAYQEALFFFRTFAKPSQEAITDFTSNPASRPASALIQENLKKIEVLKTAISSSQMGLSEEDGHAFLVRGEQPGTTIEFKHFNNGNCDIYTNHEKGMFSIDGIKDTGCDGVPDKVLWKGARQDHTSNMNLYNAVLGHLSRFADIAVEVYPLEPAKALGNIQSTINTLQSHVNKSPYTHQFEKVYPGQTGTGHALSISMPRDGLNFAIISQGDTKVCITAIVTETSEREFRDRFCDGTARRAPLTETDFFESDNGPIGRRQHAEYANVLEKILVFATAFTKLDLPDNLRTLPHTKATVQSNKALLTQFGRAWKNTTISVQKKTATVGPLEHWERSTVFADGGKIELYFSNTFEWDRKERKHGKFLLCTTGIQINEPNNGYVAYNPKDKACDSTIDNVDRKADPPLESIPGEDDYLYVARN